LGDPNGSKEHNKTIGAILAPNTVGHQRQRNNTVHDLSKKGFIERKLQQMLSKKEGGLDHSEGTDKIRRAELAMRQEDLNKLKEQREKQFRLDE
jgi:hypothetical protein